jgi:hypothetical protein
MLYKVKIGRDEYLGTPEEVVAMMSRAKGAPPGGPQAFMRGIASRLEKRGREEGAAGAIDVADPAAFLASLAAAGFLTMEERPEASRERVPPAEAVGDGPIAYGRDVDPDDVDVDGL